MSDLHIVVFTGIPSDGKTSIAKELESCKCGYISTDSIRHELYPRKFPIEIEYPRDWEPIWDKVCSDRDTEIKNNKHVVIDSCAQNRYIRDRFFSVTKYLEELHRIYRELVWLHVDSDELLRRERIRRRNPEDLKRIIEAMKTDFQDPREYEFLGVELLQYPNNTPEDQQVIVYDLKRRMNIL